MPAAIALTSVLALAPAAQPVSRGTGLEEHVPAQVAVEETPQEAGRTTAIGQAPGDGKPAPDGADEPQGGALPGADVAAVNNPAVAVGEGIGTAVPGFKPWEVGGFVDANYGYSSNNPENHVYRGTAVQPRTGEFVLNHVVAYIRRDATPGVFSPVFELAVQAGPAADALVAYEPNPGGGNGKFAGPEVWKHLSRANIGFRTRGGTELSAGLHVSPVGIGIHWSPYNWNYTVTWQLNSVPYYLSGLKLVQPIGRRHGVQVWLTNGWQLLSDNNRAPSLMLGYTFTTGPEFSLAEYVWVGPEQADMRPGAWRIFSDTQFTYNRPRWGVGGLFDAGGERRTDLPTRPWNLWVVGAVFSRWRVLGEKRTWDMSLRPEFFWDRDGRIFGVPQALLAATYTNDVRLFDNLLFRVEYRYDRSTNPDGFFYRGAAIADDARGLARDQHTVFFAVAGVFAHRFGGRKM